MNTNMLEAALRYADLGFRVFPCVPNEKKPITEHGFHDATLDQGKIDLLWDIRPNANVAICTDGLVVIDVDGTGEEWLGDQDERWQTLAVAPSAMTPRGGRHFFFRQPHGKTWRNTQSSLAPNVDTRANGGYVVVAPSIVDGKAYHWCEGYALEVSPEKLPEPPDWLIEQLDHPRKRPAPSSAGPETDDMIPEGRRNGTLTSLAGVMRRAGMRCDEIVAALLLVNRNRCKPPLNADEVERIANSVARYAPADVGQAVPGGMPEVLEPPKSLREMTEAFPRLREPVIHGLLRRGETMNVISLPKLGKSWLVIDLALAISSGRTWLGTFETVLGDVLILDNELHEETIAHRIPKVALARGIPLEVIEERLHVRSLRGQLRDIFNMGPFFRSLERGRFNLIILDAFYRFMPSKSDENDNGTMASIYNQLDRYAADLECSLVLIHHTSKGIQSGKLITDVGAGAGAQSRAADSHLILRQHQEAGVVVMEAAVRSWPPVTPTCLLWEFPIWVPAMHLDPANLKSDRPNRKETANPSVPKSEEVSDFVKRFINDQPQTKEAILQRADEAGFSERKANRLLKAAEGTAMIYRWTYGSHKPVAFATIAKSEKSKN